MFISQFRTQKKIKDVEKDILKSLYEYTFNKNIKLILKKKFPIITIFFLNLILNYVPTRLYKKVI